MKKKTTWSKGKYFGFLSLDVFFHGKFLDDDWTVFSWVNQSSGIAKLMIIGTNELFALDVLSSLCLIYHRCNSQIINNKLVYLLILFFHSGMGIFFLFQTGGLNYSVNTKLLEGQTNLMSGLSEYKAMLWKLLSVRLYLSNLYITDCMIIKVVAMCTYSWIALNVFWLPFTIYQSLCIWDCLSYESWTSRKIGTSMDSSKIEGCV